MKCYQITILGNITRKGFRFSAMQMAYKLSIKGFVKYKEFGCIVVEAEGKKKKLQQFVEWCKQGPIWAKVDDISVNEIELKGYTSFNILHEKHHKFETVESPINQPKKQERRKSLFKMFLSILELDENRNKRRSRDEESNPENLMIGVS